ncbi:MAG: MaoC family dehydratase N-terminal domain-containing protein [Dehalococcoidia bacterium]|nr:MaoC family dehydratase N-terminal domain-containing protein [Dehalococcoidia bacterium]
MADESILTDEIKAMIGTLSEPVIMEVGRVAIRRYADAVGDDNPLFHEVEDAKAAGYEDIICPPGFWGWPIKGRATIGGMSIVGAVLVKAGLFRILDGGVDQEFYIPIRAGDILTSYSKIADIREREGKTGRMIFTTVETTYLNQNGDTVAVNRATIIAR